MLHLGLGVKNHLTNSPGNFTGWYATSSVVRTLLRGQCGTHAGNRNRTCDHLITSQVLYHLSYSGIAKCWLPEFPLGAGVDANTRIPGWRCGESNSILEIFSIIRLHAYLVI